MTSATLRGLASASDVSAALHAWRTLNSGDLEPSNVTTMKRTHKSCVLLFDNAGPGGTGVVAKRCSKSTAEIERTIYQRVLPNLPRPCPEVYGVAPDDDPAFQWIFIEEAIGDAYQNDNPEHQALVLDWLAMLHSAAPRLIADLSLPERASAHYRAHLHSAIAQMTEYMGATRRPNDPDEIVPRLAELCYRLEDKWATIEVLSSRFPVTLTHGDIAGKNVRIHSGSTVPAVLVVDWETAGKAPPAADIAQFTGGTVSPELRVWGDSVVGGLGYLSDAEILQLGSIGRIFRLVASIDWAAASLQYSSSSRAVNKLHKYWVALSHVSDFPGDRGLK